MQRTDIVDDLDRAFMAGVLHARGKAYLGVAARASGTTRYVPSLAVELSGAPERHHPLLRELFGEPKERRYYSAPVWRYVTQDRTTIVAILASVAKFLPAGQLTDMAEWCTTKDEARKEQLATQLRTKHKA